MTNTLCRYKQRNVLNNDDLTIADSSFSNSFDRYIMITDHIVNKSSSDVFTDENRYDNLLSVEKNEKEKKIEKRNEKRNEKKDEKNEKKDDEKQIENKNDMNENDMNEQNMNEQNDVEK